MAKFFIDRPVFAWVIAIGIMLAGILSIFTLPVAQYPQIAPPKIVIRASYPGASAKTVETNVIQIIEQRMVGLDNFLYMNSQSSSVGSAQVTLTFAPGTDPDTAQVQVQNKLQSALSRLPQIVQRLGVRVTKAQSTFLMIVGLISPDGTYQDYDLSDLMVSRMVDSLQRVEGVGNITVFGGKYAMRIWINPHKLNRYQLTPQDVLAAIHSQNNQVSVGSLGGTPAVPGQEISAIITTQNMMHSPEEFGNILIKVNANGSGVRLADVARVEIGSESYTTTAAYNGHAAVGAAVDLATGANAMATAKAVKAKVAELKQYLPADVEVVYPFDTTKFIEVSITEVVHTLIEAVVLVVLVMFLFMQNVRATLIPAIAVPVVLLGTFGIMSVFGFSINTLTMFGLVLAIGLLVDDAIVVVENVERLMAQEKLSAIAATRKTMDEIVGALVGVAVVLSAVFIPMAFFGGSTGTIYRQFSITIVSAMVLSVIVAVILTPALCATLLKPPSEDGQGEEGHGRQRRIWSGFNRLLEQGTRQYTHVVAFVLKRMGRFTLIYLFLLLCMGFLFVKLPTAFIPEEDQGILITMAQLPSGATLERTTKVLDKVQQYFLTREKDTVDSIFTVSGFSYAGMGQNMGMGFVQLKNWEERKAPGQDVNAIIGRSMGFFSGIKEAMVFSFNLPSIPGLGTATGFDLFLKDRAGMGHEKLIAARNMVLGMAAKNPVLGMVRPNGMEDTAQYNLHVDYEKAMALGLQVDQINQALGIAWGSAYINDFLNQGKIKQVYIQADARYRMNPQDINLWHLRNNKGQMVPLSAITQGTWGYGSPQLERFNGDSALELIGQAAPGYSSGEAMKAISDIIGSLPDGFGFEWTGASYQEVQSGQKAQFLYLMSLLVVFLCLAALYESWSVPFSVILAVPLGVLGALLAAFCRGLENDVYFQVGLLTTIGLSAKNAILIVEFAKQRVDAGMELIPAALEAARLRLRPILMTSLAFILGVLPLAISTGAGANSRHAIGTGVLGGMVSATVLALVFIPLFFVAIYGFFGKSGTGKKQK